MTGHCERPECSSRPDVPHVGAFNHFQDAVAEASFRAAVTRRYYRVRFERANHWWQITEGDVLGGHRPSKAAT